MVDKKVKQGDKPVKIIFDTDIGGDCDDAGALALIHRLCDKGEAELLAVTHCSNSSRRIRARLLRLVGRCMRKAD